MDVSIAVSLIRGQMGTVVERAVNVAVETVLAEMLKVVGVKFEDLKTQVELMKNEMMALQREKAVKEKENDSIRARLRYTELKLKYYRQGVEEELQQRTSTSTLIHIHPPTQRGRAGAPPIENSPACSMNSGTQATSNQVSSVTESRHAVTVRCCPDVVSSNTSGTLLPVTLPLKTPAECLNSNSAAVPCSAEPDGKDEEQECEWTVSMVSEAAEDSPSAPTWTGEAEQSSTSVSESPDVSSQAELPCLVAQVKQEVPQLDENVGGVICIKEEEQEVMTTLLLDCPETQRSGADWSRPAAGQINLNPAVSSTGPSDFSPPQFSVSFDPSSVAAPSRQAIRPWPEENRLYEEYKLHKEKLRQRNLNRRRELEKSLPQHLLADLVRERREKTRLRVARWRAKRKLQACLNQAKADGNAGGLSQTTFLPTSQKLIAPCASINYQNLQPAAPQTNRFLSSTVPATMPLLPSSSSSVLLRGSDVVSHEHKVTSSSSFQQAASSQQIILLTNSNLLQ